MEVDDVERVVGFAAKEDEGAGWDASTASTNLEPVEGEPADGGGEVLHEEAELREGVVVERFEAREQLRSDGSNGLAAAIAEAADRERADLERKVDKAGRGREDTTKGWEVVVDVVGDASVAGHKEDVVRARGDCRE